jgi:hypothetical protein
LLLRCDYRRDLGDVARPKLKSLLYFRRVIVPLINSYYALELMIERLLYYMRRDTETPESACKTSAKVMQGPALSRPGRTERSKFLCDIGLCGRNASRSSEPSASDIALTSLTCRGERTAWQILVGALDHCKVVQPIDHASRE